MKPELIEEMFKFAGSQAGEDCNILNFEEACEYMDVSKRFLNKLCKNKEITHIKIGKLKLFREKDCNEYLLHAYRVRHNLYEE